MENTCIFFYSKNVLASKSQPSSDTHWKPQPSSSLAIETVENFRNSLHIDGEDIGEDIGEATSAAQLLDDIHR